MNNQLNISEKIYLLISGEKKTKPTGTSVQKLDVVLASSLLMDLALENRIDSDIQGTIIPDSSEPIGSKLLDNLMSQIHNSPQKKDVIDWIALTYKDIENVKQQLQAELIEKGILKDRKGLGLFSSNKGPKANVKDIQFVKNQLREVIFSDEIPEFHDITLLSLLYFGEMIQFILSDAELNEHRERIENLAQLDIIGQSISAAVDDITIAIEIQASKGSKGKSPMDEFQELIKATTRKYRLKPEQLPEWMRQGTHQYKETLRFIHEHDTGLIMYNVKTNQYAVRKYSGSLHLF